MSKRLDRLVAERVMGWKWVECGSTDYDGVMHNLRVLMPPQVATVDNLVASLAPRGGMSPDAFLGKFTPSSDISAAWEVVEKMRAQKWGYSIVEPWQGKCRMMFTRRPEFAEVGVGETLLADSESAFCQTALAICLAAARAMGVPESEIQEALTDEK